jgi:hypothetical protein
VIKPKGMQFKPDRDIPELASKFIFVAKIVAQLLGYCGRCPEFKSVLAMENALFHHLDRIAQRCEKASVKLF